MRYLILLRGDSEGEAALSADDRRAIVERHRALNARLRETGRLVAGEALEGGGKVIRGALVTDGPFAETKEQIGGFYLVDVESEDEALAIAREIPDSPGLVVELLPTAG